MSKGHGRTVTFVGLRGNGRVIGAVPVLTDAAVIVGVGVHETANLLAIDDFGERGVAGGSTVGTVDKEAVLLKEIGGVRAAINFEPKVGGVRVQGNFAHQSTVVGFARFGAANANEVAEADVGDA